MRKKRARKEALELFYKRHFEEAYKALLEIVDDYPKDWEIYAALSYLEAYIKHDLDASTVLLNKAKACGCPLPDYHRAYAEILWKKEEFQQACSEYAKAASEEPSVRNLTAYVDSLMRIDYNLAPPVWRKILEQEPDNAKAYFALAWIAASQENWTEALTMALKSNELQPKDKWTSFVIGRAYQGLEKYEKALSYFLDAEKQGFEHAFSLYYHIAKCYYELGDYAKDIQYTFMAIKSNSADSDFKKRLHDHIEYICRETLPWLIETAQYEKAYSIMKAAMDIFPDDSEMLAYRGVLEKAFKQNDKGCKEYIDKAFELNNADLDLLYRIKGALLWDHLNEKKQGLDLLQKSVDLNPSVRNQMALANRIAEMDPAKAKCIYQEILDKEPENLDVIVCLAHLAQCEKDWDKELELAKRGYLLDPSYPFTSEFMAYAYFNLGRVEEALECYQKAVELNHPEKAPIYHGIAECYEELGDRQEAYKYIRMSLDINPDNAEAKALASNLIQTDHSGDSGVP